MPLRRRHIEPSPRVQAILAAPSQVPTARSGRPGALDHPVGESDGSGADVDGSDRGVTATGRPDPGTDPGEPWGWVPRHPLLDGRVGDSAKATDGAARAPDRARRYRGRHRGPARGAPPAIHVPGNLRDARYAVSTPAVVGALLVLLLGVAGFGGRVLLADRSSIPVQSGTGGSPSGHGGGASGDRVPRDAGPSGAPVSSDVPSGISGGTGVSANGDRSGFGGAPTATTGDVLVVDVVGEVRRPGVVRLPGGARVQDAVAAAGGTTAKADLAAVNMARLVVDGEQIRIPRPGEVVTPPPGGGSGSAGAGAPVNINTADQPALESLPGVGPVLAGRILEWRAQHGRFTSVAELGEVSGIGETLLGQLAGKVTV